MTDEEMKRLEGLILAIPQKTTSNVNINGPDKVEVGVLLAYFNMLQPRNVLALIERVRKSERKGAEEMRKAVVIRLRETARGHDEVADLTRDYDVRQQELSRGWGYEEAAEDASLLRLPGDAP